MNKGGLNKEQRDRWYRKQTQMEPMNMFAEVTRLSQMIGEDGEYRELLELNNPRWQQLVTEAASMYTLSQLDSLRGSLPEGFEMVRLLMGLSYVSGYVLGVEAEEGEDTEAAG